MKDRDRLSASETIALKIALGCAEFRSRPGIDGFLKTASRMIEKYAESQYRRKIRLAKKPVRVRILP